MKPAAALLVLCVLAPAPALAQTQTDNRQIDLKPLLRGKSGTGELGAKRP